MPGSWHEADLYFGGQSHFSIPLAGLRLIRLQLPAMFSDIGVSALVEDVPSSGE